jgi:hypothetical protein
VFAIVASLIIVKIEVGAQQFIFVLWKIDSIVFHVMNVGINRMSNIFHVHVAVTKALEYISFPLFNEPRTHGMSDARNTENVNVSSIPILAKTRLNDR